MEASNLFIPGEKKCFKRSCSSVIDDLWGVILMCDSAPKESIRHPHLWSVGHCQVFYPIWGQAFWIYNYSFDILIFGEQFYKMSSISSLSMSSVLNDIYFVLWLKYSVSRHKLLLTFSTPADLSICNWSRQLSHFWLLWKITFETSWNAKAIDNVS